MPIKRPCPCHVPLPCILPQVELVSEGDSVNELFVVVSGQLCSYRTSNLFNAEVSGCTCMAACMAD